jgi:hypothetical protein
MPASFSSLLNGWRVVPQGVVAVLVLAVLVNALRGEGPAPTAAVPPAELQRAVERLSSDLFLERELATQQLLEFGGAAIESLEAAIGAGELETIARGLGVLEQLALRSDDATEREAATAAVLRLAAVKQPRVAERSQALLLTIRQTRRNEAMAYLERLGAKFPAAGQALAGPALLPTPVESALEIGSDWRGTEADLLQLPVLFDLKHASLSGEQVTDAWLTQVASLPALQSLTLKRTKVTADGIAKLRALPDLQRLDVLYSPIDDSVCEPLAEMQRLSQLRLFGTKVSKQAAAQLAAKLPNAKIDLRQGGFFGIGVQPDPLGCIITNVQPRSAAGQAGIQVGDVIVSFAGEKVTNFEQLTAVIARFEPGSEVTVELVRDEGPETLTVKLGEWD